MTVNTGNEAPDMAAFLLSPEELRQRRNTKWNQFPPDVIPSFIADMDFRVAPPVQAAILQSVEREDYGYQMRDGAKADRMLAGAFAARMEEAFGWKASADLVLPVSDLVQATYAAILTWSGPGDGVILQVPNYPPFRETLQTTGRRLIPLHMDERDGTYVFDLDRLETQIDANTRIFVLCNPQNPTGRVFSRDELEAVLAFAEKHDLLVISDEIHAELIYGDRPHIPFPALSPAAAARCVLLNSATKSFNIPGLRCAVMYFGTPELKAAYQARIPLRLTGSVNSLGIDATVAAWTQGQPWLDAVLAHLRTARDHLCGRLASELPGLRFHPPEATYLLWMDCSDLGIQGSAGDFFLDRAGVGFSRGEDFLPGAESRVRCNFATSLPILDEIVDRMVAALRSNAR
ncbi:MalY/PatB family protein [Celeribacter indicus]|uniref:cysteine-S-conjugate beta-lyase n=1 Tax=Celeribacter indicus TaxID=1208324 RepID=A0A0B5DTG4_9RHOB|nr:aminotransferase class I/II-fold pyridoxal phosphate-dependent enzyme [Celeribacter indicus]AJE46718.1 aspartate/tyrosine/aromatic aminotransferase protein [Celeribacter indicus]SDX04717.1 cystathione beta-lyase [Celeribacter indicus]